MKYAKAVELNPDNASIRAGLARAKLRAAQVHFDKGRMYRASGRPELAVVELEQAILLDPTHDYAGVELRKAREEVAQKETEKDADTHMEKIKKKARGSRAVSPLLEPSSDRPINLNFPQPKPIKQIYRALADAAGINIIFDPQLKDDNVSIVLTGIEFQKALETLLRQENHFYKIIDERTILIAADTPANRKTYEDLVIRTFFLSNGDVTEVANSLRALLQTTRISVNKAENSITLRDTADKVSVAERIVEQNDKQLAEVVIDVEVLQINTRNLETLGLAAEALLRERHHSGAGRRDEPDGPARGRPVHVGPAQTDLHSVLRLHDPERPARLHQGQRLCRAPGEPAAAGLRGTEGAAPDRRQGADPDDDVPERVRDRGRERWRLR